MGRSFEAALAEQCAPTLAGIKPASLFPYQAEDAGLFRQVLLRWARELAPFGIAVRILRTCSRTGTSLIYLYRAGWIRSILTESANREFLQQIGYELDRGCSGLLEQLSGKLCLEQDFPHEIGVFLGYPLEDVIGFIENRGRNFTHCGYWKSYGNPDEARRRFDHYRHCTAAFMEHLQRGGTVTGLIAA